MNLRTIIIGLIALLLLVMAGIVAVLLSDVVVGEAESSPTSFSVLETGAASGFAYGVYNYRGEGNLTVISYDREPKRKIVVINDSQAIQATRLPELVESLRPLERYGFDLKVSDEPKIGDAIYVIPTGAIPSYALFNLQQNSSNATIIYIGGRDLLLSSGIKRLEWYNALSAAQKARVVQYNGTLDEFLDGNVSLEHEILLSGWMAKNSTAYSVSGDGLKTAVVPFNKTGYLRIVYEFRDLYGIYDSPRLQSLGQPLQPEPPVIFPWEKSSLQYTLNKTNGTAFLSVKNNGKVIEHEQLRRVTDQNVFFKKFEYSEPGEYVIIVDDNSGVIASGLLHVKDTQIRLIEKSGYTCVFSVMVDGRPLDNAEAYVSLGNSSKRKYFISDGQMVVSAKLVRGENIFNIELGGATIPVKYDNQEDPLIEFYLKYGVPAFAIVAVVYFGARISKRPTYRLRFGDSADYVRAEMSLPIERAMESFAVIRKDMKLGKSPITPHEFSVSLKRYLTNGADVTEGNVEEILKKLVDSGRLENHRDYYQMKGEGDVVRNVLRRMVREKLIESGTPFREDAGKFITKDFEIGFFGERFAGKGIIVVDDKAEEKGILERMSESERARFRIQQSNGMISFVPIDRLSDVL
ncbi:hypothetical protein L0Y65_02390 [Candidatus Micrarchaeota archaeon]|nr:hypothetical protein [Candidatus Micrarchaeota archaeon]